MPHSQAEVRLAHAVLEGNARNAGMGRQYAREVVSKMHGRKMDALPQHSESGPHAVGGVVGTVPAVKPGPVNIGASSAGNRARIPPRARSGPKGPQCICRSGKPDPACPVHGKVREQAPGEKSGSDPGPVPNRSGQAAKGSPPMPVQGKDTFGRKFQPVSKKPVVPGATKGKLPPGRRLLVPLLFILACAGAHAQQAVNVLKYPYSTNPTTLYFYDGSNNITYICYARPDQPTSSFSVSAGSLTSLSQVDPSATITFPSPHGLKPGNGIVITGSATAALNGTYAVVTVPSTTTLTISTATLSIPNATYTDFTLSTNAPLTSRPVWSIQHFNYAGSNVDNQQWAKGVAGNFTNICDNRAAVNGPLVITYK